ncbi:CG9254 [Drosophila busckii]|uniref:CG9254 n=1 Tax=Drosophila busckii TaxID=30019 RepID=A0A0M3QU02_DROBS|nr:putative inorganic phosphate cotransporter [Drosophila busckii]ALC39779.1 CG9254 [Drosophila busckii]
MDHQPEWGRKLSKCCLIPQRIILAFMCFWAIVICYATRVCLSHVVTVIVVKQNVTDKDTVCPREDTNDDSHDKDAVYEWSSNVVGLLLGVFFGTYVLLHIPGGLLSDKYGGKWVLFISMVVGAISVMLSPISITMVDKDELPWALVVMRTFLGASQGPLYPAVSSILSSWVPAKERGKLAAVTLGAGAFGSILSNSLSGVLLDKFDWPYTFYCFGMLNLIWCIPFGFMCFNYPATHPYLSEKEYNYLKGEMDTLERKIKPMPPWCAIFKSPAVWVMIIAQVGHDWGLFVILIDLPLYFSNVIGIPIMKNGFYSALPFLALWISTIICGFLADIIIKKEWLKINTQRIVFTVISSWAPGLLMVAASYAKCNIWLTVLLFTICLATMGPYYSGLKLTPLDLSPNYAGTLTAITNGIGSITGYLAPQAVGIIAKDSTLAQWRIVFWLSFGILFVTAIPFIFWGTGEKQDFDSVGDAKKEDKPKEEKPKTG